MSNNLIKRADAITSDIREEVNRLIFESLPSKDPVAEVQLLYDMMRDYPSRPGKGLRPAQCVLYCRAFGGNGNAAMPTAAALELFQNWIVIHDDIEDYSELRRGKPALHQKHGVPLAINTGDALAGRMWEMLLTNQDILGETIALRLFHLFLDMLHRTTAGQHIELSWVENGRWDLGEDDYLNMCRHKTAYYTCVVPVIAGAIIAKQEGFSESAIEQFGHSLGVAFQIRDDILNLIGDEAKYGKEHLGDIYEGKRTLMVIHCLENARTADRERLIDVISKPRHGKTLDEVTGVVEMFQEYGSIDYARNVSKQLAQMAKSEFQELEFPGPQNAIEDIKIIIDYMVDRDY